MTEIPRVELPALLAQTEQAARLGALRSQPNDAQRLEDEAYELELLSRQRNEEVQASEQTVESHDRKRQRQQREEAPPRRGRDSDDGEDDSEHHIDLTA